MKLLKYCLFIVALITLAACGGGGSDSSSSTSSSSSPATTQTISAPYMGVKNGEGYYTKDQYSVTNVIRSDLTLVNGKDYSFTINFSPSSLQKNVTFNWQFPDVLLDSMGSKKYAYPEIAWGNSMPLTGYSNPSAAVAQIKNISTFNVDYSVTLLGDTANYSLLHDIWIYDQAGVITGEIMVYPSPNNYSLYFSGINGYYPKQPGAETFLYSDNGFSWNIVVVRVTNFVGYEMWTYFLTPATVNQTPPQSIDVLKIINFLSSRGKLNTSDYIHGVEMGSEVHKGSGGMVVNSYTVNLSTK